MLKKCSTAEFKEARIIKYPTLIGSLARQGIKKKDVAKLLGIGERALRNKLTGKVQFTWTEAQKIRNTWFPEMLYDVLFATSE